MPRIGTPSATLVLSACLSALLSPRLAFGQEPERSYSFYFENDVDFLSRKGDDRFYTHGARLAVQWQDCYLPRWLRSRDEGETGIRLRLPFVARLTDLGSEGDRLICQPLSADPETPDPFGPATSAEPVYRFTVGAHLAQNLYTPEDISVAAPQPNDRPYGAWLYGGITVDLASEHLAHSLEVDLGVVGPSAWGEEVQNFVHEYITDSAEARGWDRQIQDEAALLLLYTGRWRLLEVQRGPTKVFDLIPSWGGALGNVFTYGKVGLFGRLGWNLPADFGPAGPLPAVRAAGAEEPPDWDAYLFAGAEGRAVARNIFLDGNTFRDSASVEKEDFVADLEIGFSVRWQEYRLTYRQVRRSPEFVQQAEKQTFGGVVLSWNPHWDRAAAK